MLIIEKNKLGFLIILLILLSYFFGFYIREISNGAGHIDLEHHIWLVISDLKKNYFQTIVNYQNNGYGEATFPFFHSFQSFFNPATKNILYCLNNTIFNLFVIFIFYQFLKFKKIEFENNFLIILIPFILLLSPWFRSSSYWGMTENFAFFFLIPSLYYLDLLISKKISFNKNLLLTILISLTLYARQQYIFLALFHLLVLLLNNNKRELIFTIIIYSLLSLPGFYVLFTWGVFDDLSQTTSSSSSLNVKNILMNIPKISSLFFFYTIPLILINFSKFLEIFFSKKCILFFIGIFTIKLILFHDLSYSNLSGGFIVKFTQFFLFNDTKLLIFISSAFFAFIISVIKLSNYKYFLILPLIYLNLGFITTVYQEWIDPLYIFIYFLFLSKDQISNLKLDRNNTIKTLFYWEVGVLIIAFIYYHKIKDIPLFYTF